MNLDTSKNLGGIGALLVVIACLGFFGSGYAGLLSIVGVILLLISAKGLADYYNESSIFNNALYGFITAIVGGVVFIGVLVATVLATLADLGIDLMDPDIATTLPAKLTDFTIIFDLLGAIIVALVVLFIFIVVASVLCRKSLSTLAAKSGVGMFGTAGLLLLIGAVLTIILIGFIIIWIAFILLIVAFFSIKATAPQQRSEPPPPPS